VTDILKEAAPSSHKKYRYSEWKKYFYHEQRFVNNLRLEFLHIRSQTLFHLFYYFRYMS